MMLDLNNWLEGEYLPVPQAALHRLAADDCAPRRSALTLYYPNPYLNRHSINES